MAVKFLLFPVALDLSEHPSLLEPVLLPLLAVPLRLLQPLLPSTLLLSVMKELLVEEELLGLLLGLERLLLEVRQPVQPLYLLLQGLLHLIVLYTVKKLTDTSSCIMYCSLSLSNSSISLGSLAILSRFLTATLPSSIGCICFIRLGDPRLLGDCEANFC